MDAYLIWFWFISLFSVKCALYLEFTHSCLPGNLSVTGWHFSEDSPPPLLRNVTLRFMKQNKNYNVDISKSARLRAPEANPLQNLDNSGDRIFATILCKTDLLPLYTYQGPWNWNGHVFHDCICIVIICKWFKHNLWHANTFWHNTKIEKLYIRKPP